MTLRSFDVDSTAWRAALVETARLASAKGFAGMISHRRARNIVDDVLEVIRDNGEDVDAVIADLRASTAEAELETQRSGGRRARLEAALGISTTVRGEVVG